MLKVFKVAGMIIRLKSMMRMKGEHELLFGMRFTEVFI